MPKYFNKCILHIGTEKTGTTTLQKFLGTNRAALAERGYYVPRSLAPYPVLANHERLTTTSLEPGKLNDDLRRAAGLRTVEDVLVHRSKVQEELAAEIRGGSQIPRILLLSNEHCHSRLVSDIEVQTLYDFLSDFTEYFELIVYLRPQHELALSAYDQALKAGYADIDVMPSWPSNKTRWIERKYFDYEDLTSRWGRIFGPEQVRPQIFVRSELAAGSIIDDFLRTIGCDGKGMTVPKDENTSISSELQSVLNIVNRYAMAHPGSITSQGRASLIVALQGLPKEIRFRTTRSEVTEFYARFEDSNERVRQRYFPQRATLFSPDFAAFQDHASEGLSEIDVCVRALLAITEQ